MIVFDFDENGRIIAIASMEPVNRSDAKLKRALGS
jgi:hypothetical protein